MVPEAVSTMMGGYYESHTGVHLSRPLITASLPGGRGDEVAHALASMTGLPLAHVDVHLMHRTGMGLASDVQSKGLNAMQIEKTKVLHAAMQRTPHPIIALGDVSVMAPSVWEEVRRSADTLYVEWSDLEMLSLLGQVSAMKRRQYWQLAEVSFDGFDDVTRCFSASRAVLRECHQILSGRGRSSLELAGDVMQMMNLTTSKP